MKKRILGIKAKRVKYFVPLDRDKFMTVGVCYNLYIIGLKGKRKFVMHMESYRSKSLDETLKKLCECGDKACIIAGGTDIIIKIRDKKVAPKVMVDISDIDELRGIRDVGSQSEIGAATTFTDLVEANELKPNLKGLIDAAASVGSPQIRNMGTIGGNICNGSPAADTVPPLLALNSTAIISSISGLREIALEDIFLDKGYTQLKHDEILTSVRFPKLSENEVVTFSKLGPRNALAISKICLAVYIKKESGVVSDIRIGSGSLGKHGLREKNVEERLRGKKLDEAFIVEAVTAMEKELKNRLRGRSSLDFKLEAAKGVLENALVQAVEFFTKKEKAGDLIDKTKR